MKGPVLGPDDDGYDRARSVWNGLYDRRPAAVFSCQSAADVVEAVEYARDAGRPISVKSGGHHVSGSAVCDDGVLVDLSPMDAIAIDPATRTVRVEAGATWGAVDEACLRHGLVVPGSQDPSVGVGGLTLGGGTGWLSPQFGLSADNLRSAEVVTASGEPVRASQTANPDLFWAIRGGGGNFGVVPAFEFELHEFEPSVLAGSLIYRPEVLPEFLPRYEAFMADAPPEVRPLLGLMELPAAAYYPTEVHHQRVLLVVLFYGGDPAEGASVLEPLRSFGEPVMDSVRSRDYLSWQRVGEAADVRRTDLRSQFLDTFSEAARAALVDHGTDVPSSASTVFISPRHGAEVEPPVDATAYPHRHLTHHVLVETRWDDPARDRANLDWVRRFHDALDPFSTGAAELNFLTAAEIPGRVPAALGENYDRLAELKTVWDPENRFRSNPNIVPNGPS